LRKTGILLLEYWYPGTKVRHKALFKEKALKNPENDDISSMIPWFFYEPMN